MSLSKPDLDEVPDKERPIDLPVLLAGVDVDEAPHHVVHVRGGVDLRHQVLPLQAIGRVVIVRLAVPFMGCSCVCTLPAFAAVAGTSRIPHFGHAPSVFEVTSGCIGHTYEVGAGTSFMPHCGHVPGSVETTSGCIGQVVAQAGVSLSSRRRREAAYVT